MTNFIQHQVLFTLTSLEVARDNIKFKNVALPSDKTIAVRSSSAVQLITVSQPPTCMKLPVVVDSLTMHPSLKILALRAGNRLQIFNLEMKTMMGQALVPAGEEFVHWKFVSDKIIAIVTETGVYHWHYLNRDQSPSRLCDRLVSQRDQQVVNVGSSDDFKWHFVTSISSHAGTIRGHLDLFNSELEASQPEIESTAATIATFELEGENRSMLCFETTKSDIRNIALVQLAAPGQARIKPIHIPLPAFADNDFIVHIIADAARAHLWIVSRAGVIICIDVLTSVIVHKITLTSVGTLFVVARSSDTVNGGLLAVAHSGEVIRLRLGPTEEIKSSVVPSVPNGMVRQSSATRPTIAATPAKAATPSSAAGSVGFPFAATLATMCLKPEFCDIEFVCKEELKEDSKLMRVAAHRIVIACASPALYQLMNSSAVVRNTSTTNAGSSNGAQYESMVWMERDGMRYRCIQTLLQWIYTGTLSSSTLPIALVDIPCLRTAAATYALPTLLDALSEAETSFVTIDTAIDAINLGRSFVCAHMATLVEHSSFVRLTKPALKSLLIDDSLSIHELPLFLAVIRWAQHQQPSVSLSVMGTTSDGILVDILPLIRFPLLSIQHFASIVAPLGVLTNEAMVSLYSYIATPSYERNPATVPFSSKPRAPAPPISAALLASLQATVAKTPLSSQSAILTPPVSSSSSTASKPQQQQQSQAAGTRTSPSAVDEVSQPAYPLFLRTASTPAPHLPVTRPPPALPSLPPSQQQPTMSASAVLPPKLPTHAPPPPPQALPRASPPPPPPVAPPAVPVGATPLSPPFAQPVPHQRTTSLTSTTASMYVVPPPGATSLSPPSPSMVPTTISQASTPSSPLAQPIEIPETPIPRLDTIQDNNTPATTATPITTGGGMSTRSEASISSVEASSPWVAAMAAAADGSPAQATSIPPTIPEESLVEPPTSSTPPSAVASSTLLPSSTTDDNNVVEDSAPVADEFDFPDH